MVSIPCSCRHCEHIRQLLVLPCPGPSILLAATREGVLHAESCSGSFVSAGQSVGSGPTCHLGAKVPGLAGVILHSPLATGMRVMNPTWTRWPSWLDVFPNIKLISKISAPTLIMHVRAFLCTPLFCHIKLDKQIVMLSGQHWKILGDGHALDVSVYVLY